MIRLQSRKRKIFQALFVLFAGQPTYGDEISFNLRNILGLKVSIASGTAEKVIDTPASVVVITREQILERGYTSLHEIFWDLPGFDVAFTQGTQYLNAHQRGYRQPLFSRTLLMLDGQVQNTLWGQLALPEEQFPLSGVERIEILYGPVSAVYGPNAFLGVVNIITADAKKLADEEIETRAWVNVGSWNSRSVDVTTLGRQADFRFKAMGKYFETNGPDYSDRSEGFFGPQYRSKEHWGPIHGQTGVRGPCRVGEWCGWGGKKGLFLMMGKGGLELRLETWEAFNAYGPYYASDRTANALTWGNIRQSGSLAYEKQISEKLSSASEIMFVRTSRLGDFAENYHDPTQGSAAEIIYNVWAAPGQSLQSKQTFKYNYNDLLTVLFGFRYDSNETVRAYHTPGYWCGDSFSPDVPCESAVFYQNSTIFKRPPEPSIWKIHAQNSQKSRDTGVFLVGIYDSLDHRFNLGVRVDENSEYGQSVNPRLSVLTRTIPGLIVKAIYGESFQEPPPLQLYGKWGGRDANPDLKPEKARNSELIAIHQSDRSTLEMSLFYARYSNVIKEEAANAGERKIHGFEARFSHDFFNFADKKPMTAHTNYTYTVAKGSISWNNGEWENRWGEVGDIATHKANAGLYAPLGDSLDLHVSVNMVGETLLYQRNSLRSTHKIPPRSIMNLAFNNMTSIGRFTLYIKNVFDSHYNHPGGEAADAGNELSKRSRGWMSSLVPQPPRSVFLGWKHQF